VSRWNSDESRELKRKIIEALDSGMTKEGAARMLGVDSSTVRFYARREREAGWLDPRERPGPAPKVRPDQRDRLVAQLSAFPSASLREHCALWEQSHGIRLSRMVMSRTIRRLGWMWTPDGWQPRT
jgi:transposase